MSDAFSASLRQEMLTTWEQAVTHGFVRELHAGTIADAVMSAYLIQDHRFLDSFLVLLGSATATADTFTARLRLARFAGEVAGEENTYFLRAFDALGVGDERTRNAIPDTAATSGFKELFREAAAANSYPASIAVLTVAEWLYLDWASQSPEGPNPNSKGSQPANFVHAEWIALHDNGPYRDFVAFLRAELDRVGPADAAVARDFFARAVDLELAFFESVYSATPANSKN